MLGVSSQSKTSMRASLLRPICEGEASAAARSLPAGPAPQPTPPAGVRSWGGAGPISTRCPSQTYRPASCRRGARLAGSVLVSLRPSAPAWGQGMQHNTGHRATNRVAARMRLPGERNVGAGLGSSWRSERTRDPLAAHLKHVGGQRSSGRLWGPLCAAGWSASAFAAGRCGGAPPAGARPRWGLTVGPERAGQRQQQPGAGQLFAGVSGCGQGRTR